MQARAKLRGTTIADNWVTINGGADGGGIYADNQGVLTLVGTTVRNNTATGGDGGGIKLKDR